MYKLFYAIAFYVMSIRQAMGTLRTRPAAGDYVSRFVVEAKDSGWLAEAFNRNRVEGASLAP